MTSTNGEPSERLREIEARIWEIVETQVPSVRTIPDRHSGLSMGEKGLGLDSVQILDTILVIEDALGVPIPAEWLAENDPTIARIAAYVAERRDSSQHG